MAEVKKEREQQETNDNPQSQKVVSLKPAEATDVKIEAKAADVKPEQAAPAQEPAAKEIAKAPAQKTAQKTTQKLIKKPAKKKVTAKKPATKTAVKKAVPKKPALKKLAKKKAVKAASPKARAKKPQAKKPASTPKFSTTPLNLTDIKEMETIMTQSKAQFEQFTKEAADLNREGVDAFVKSSQIFAKGFEEIIKQSVAVAQASAEKQAAFLKEAMSSKTINEFSDVQNKIAQTNFDDFMSGATKITELSTKVLSEAAEPINNQVTKSVQKASDAVAAE